MISENQLSMKDMIQTFYNRWKIKEKDRLDGRNWEEDNWLQLKDIENLVSLG